MLTAGTTVIGLTPTLVDGLSVNPFRLHLHNNDNTDAVYLGGSAVTVNDGLKLLKEDSIDLIINPLEALYAVASKTGHVISWLKQTE